MTIFCVAVHAQINRLMQSYQIRMITHHGEGIFLALYYKWHLHQYTCQSSHRWWLRIYCISTF